jgi:hypothetical protein
VTLSALLAAVYADCGFQASPPTAVVTRVTRWINDGQREALRSAGMRLVQPVTLTMASVVGQALYALPQIFESIDQIIDTTNMREVLYMDQHQYRAIDPGLTSTGAPFRWVPWGYLPVLVQPAATPVYAVSSSAADTTQKVYAQFVRSNGDIQATVNATLTGTTRVQLGSLSDIAWILLVNLSATCAGTVSLYDAASNGNVLARVPIGAQSVQYQAIRLWPTPSAVYSYTIDGQAPLTDLTQTTDVPVLPPDFHKMLTDYARMREYERTDDDRLTTARAAWQDGLTRLRLWTEYPPTYRPVASSRNMTRRGYSPLGSDFPAEPGWPWR